LVTAAADGPVLRLSQEPFRYLADGGDGPDPTWVVPVILRIGEREERVLLDAEGATTALDGGPQAAVLVNAGGHGFYRVRYTGDLLARLVRSAQDRLAPIERYGLVDDTMAAVLAGRSEASEVLALARGLQDDDDLSVWQRIAAALGTLS